MSSKSAPPLTNISKLFRNPQILNEVTEVGTLSHAQLLESNKIHESILYWSKDRKDRLVAYIGPFGSGKSVILDHIRKNDESKGKDKQFEWIQFDVWRYSDRRQIWDSFVIETVSKIKRMEAQGVISEIEGDVSNFLTRVISNSIGKFCLAIVLTFLWILLSHRLWLLVAHSNYDKLWIFDIAFIESFFKYGVSMLFVGLAFFGVTSIIKAPNRPLRRVFELKSLLLKTTNDIDRPVVIVIEDVDRSNNEGMVFMETLRQFIDDRAKDHGELTNSILVIAPQDKTYFDIIQNRGIEGFERAIKIYDGVIYTSIDHINEKEVTNLLSQLYIIHSKKDEVMDTAINLVAHFGGQFSMRLFKFILREADDFVFMHPSADPVITLSFISAKYIKSSDGRSSDRVLSKLFLQRSNDLRVGAGTGYPSLRSFILTFSHHYEELQHATTLKFIFEDMVSEIEVSADPEKPESELVRVVRLHTRYKQLL